MRNFTRKYVKLTANLDAEITENSPGARCLVHHCLNSIMMSLIDLFGSN